MMEQFDALTLRLARLATHYDVTGEWPERSVEQLTRAGAWSWIIPTAYGGRKLEPISQLMAYEAVAGGCMSTALILTQRDAACEFIAGCHDEAIKAEFLPRLARHEVMTSVGISQLTTSRQGGRPAMLAEPTAGGYRLRGSMPWVTAAARCGVFVVGAALADGRQIVGMLPADAPGLRIEKPIALMALQSSQTAEVVCRNVILPERLVLRGPAESVLASRSPIKSLVVSACGIGLAGAIQLLIFKEAERNGQGLDGWIEELGSRYEAVRERLYRCAERVEDSSTEDDRAGVRVAVNDLLARLASAVLVFAKGSGLVRQHAAQRLAREALFYMVWSAPEAVRAGTLAAILDAPLDRVPPKRMATE